MRALYPWMGGKSRVREQILPLIPERKFYGEPFFGAGWVFFGLPENPRRIEAINDLDHQVINCLRVAKYHPAALLLELNQLPSSQQLWKEFQTSPGETDIQRAARWLYVQKQTWGGKADRSGWILDRRRHRWSPAALATAIEKVSKRLSRVQICAHDFSKFLDHYDSQDSFFYLDPPYPGTTEYATPFSWTDQERLAERVQRLRGGWLLSNRDTPEIRKLYQGCRLKEIEAEYRLGRPKAKALFKELLIFPRPTR